MRRLRKLRTPRWITYGGFLTAAASKTKSVTSAISSRAAQRTMQGRAFSVGLRIVEARENRSFDYFSE